MAKIQPTDFQAAEILSQNPLNNIGGPSGPVGVKYCGPCDVDSPTIDDKLTILCKRLHNPDSDCPDFLRAALNCYTYTDCMAELIFRIVASCLPESGIPSLGCAGKLNGFKDRFLPYLKGPDGVDPCSYSIFTSNTTLVDCILERLTKTTVPPGVPEPIPGVYTDTKIEEIFRGLIKELNGTTEDPFMKELGEELEKLLKAPGISAAEMREILQELFKDLRQKLPK